MKDMQKLPPSEKTLLLTEDSPSPRGDEPVGSSPLRARLMPVRLGIWSLLFLSMGMLLGYAILPLLPSGMIYRILVSHLPGEKASLGRVFLRLCLSCLPAGIWLSASGLTGFSKAVITVVLGWRGIADGMSLMLLILLTIERLNMDSHYPFHLLLAAMGGWISVRLIGRWLLSVSAHRTATAYYRVAGDQLHAARTRPVVLRHLAVTSGCFLAVTLACLVYGYILFLIV